MSDIFLSDISDDESSMENDATADYTQRQESGVDEVAFFSKS